MLSNCHAFSIASIMHRILSRIEFQSFSVIIPRPIMNLSSGAGDAKQLLFDPFSKFILSLNFSSTMVFVETIFINH